MLLSALEDGCDRGYRNGDRQGPAVAMIVVPGPAMRAAACAIALHLAAFTAFDHGHVLSFIFKFQQFVTPFIYDFILFLFYIVVISMFPF